MSWFSLVRFWRLWSFTLTSSILLNQVKTSRKFVRLWRLWLKVLIATLPLLGVFKFDDWFDTHFHNMVSVALMLIIYGLPLSIWKSAIKRVLYEPSVTELDKLPYTTAFYIGLFQVLALLPGTSRSGGNDCRWFVEWNQSFCCDRVYLLSWNSSYVWS